MTYVVCRNVHCQFSCDWVVHFIEKYQVALFFDLNYSRDTYLLLLTYLLRGIIRLNIAVTWNVELHENDTVLHVDVSGGPSIRRKKKVKDVSCKVLSQDMKGNDLCLLCPRSVTDMVRLSVSNLNINAALMRSIS